MRRKLESRWIEQLVNLPESGMGYQHVDVQLANGRVLSGLFVFNSEELELPEEFADVAIEDICLHGRRAIDTSEGTNR